MSENNHKNTRKSQRYQNNQDCHNPEYGLRVLAKLIARKYIRSQGEKFLRRNIEDTKMANRTRANVGRVSTYSSYRTLG